MLFIDHVVKIALKMPKKHSYMKRISSWRRMYADPCDANTCTHPQSTLHTPAS
jgi:hypothetical protein